MKKIAIIFLVTGLMGCNDDFLSRNSLTQLSSETFWQSEADARTGINGVYDALQDQVLYGGTLNVTNSAGIPEHDAFADNVYNNYKFEGPGNYVIGNADQSFGYFFNFWVSLYKGIGRANAAIANISKMTATQISDASKNQLLGQAKFLRALFYFNVAVYYESAPLITEVQTLQNAYVPK